MQNADGGDEEVQAQPLTDPEAVDHSAVKVRAAKQETKFSWFYLLYTANEGPVRIQYKCLVPIYVFPEMKLLIPSKNYNVLSPSSYTYTYL